jgi:hypothetical protein
MTSARLLRLIVITLAVTASTGAAATRAYFVDPRELHEGWTRQGQNTYVGQSFVANVDSIYYLEWFVGELSAPGQYKFEITQNGQFVCAGYESVPARGWQWVRCDEFTEGDLRLAKGKEYVLKVSHYQGDSVNYVYRTDNPYQYGAISVGGGHLRPPGSGGDLVCRVYGRTNAVDSMWGGVNNHYFDPSQDSGGHAALDSARALGIKWVRDDFNRWDNFVLDTVAVASAGRNYASHGFNVLGVLCYGHLAAAVSSAPDSVTNPWDRMFYPPRNLFKGVNDSTNYWAAYVRAIMESLPSVKYWEIWNEPNTSWFWDDPDIACYQGSGGASDPIDTPRERCSLYVRMCQVADSVALQLGQGRNTVGGGVWRTGQQSPDSTTVKGTTWMRHMLNLGDERYGGVENCFDLVSVHPYEDYYGVDTAANRAYPDSVQFWNRLFRRDLDSIRAVMREAGYQYMGLWVTEHGWRRWCGVEKEEQTLAYPLASESLLADNLCKFYVSARASQSDPTGGYDHISWYELTSYRVSSAARKKTDGFGLLDSVSPPKPLAHAHSLRQLGETLTGKRFNGRVLTGNTPQDSLAHMHEFEDTATLRRTWVCWSDGMAGRGIDVKLPVRSDSLACESLAYTGTPPVFSPRITDDGWLSLTLNSRPVFISEKGAPMRPDLIVDSVRLEQAGRTLVRAWVTNRGTRATPSYPRPRTPFPTWAVLKANGDSLAQHVRTASMAVNQQAEFTFDLGQTKLPDTVLLSVTVNPSQTYVELGTDDNSGYRLKTQP